MSSKFDFPVSTPESQGLSSRSILNFIDKVEEQHIAVNSLILMRHGQIVAEGYWARSLSARITASFPRPRPFPCARSCF